jgi:hypothetical protein
MNHANPLSEIGRAAAEATARATRISMTSVERAIHVQMEYAKGAVKQAALNARAAAQAKDVQELMALRAPHRRERPREPDGLLAQPLRGRSDAQSEYSRLAEERMARFQKAVTETVDQVAKSSPRRRRRRQRRDQIPARRHHRGVRQLHQGRPEPGELRRRGLRVAPRQTQELMAQPLLLLYRSIG